MYIVDFAALLSVAHGAVLVTNGLLLLATRFRARSVGGCGAGFLGLAVALQGTRVLSGVDALRDITGVDPVVLDYLGPFCLYAVAAPACMFVERFWGVGLHSSLRRLWQGALLLLVAAVAWDLVHGPGAALTACLWVGVSWCVVMAANLLGGHLKTEPGDQVAVYGIAFALACAAHDHAGPLFGGAFFEARHLGVVVCVFTVVAALVRRAQQREHRLAGLEQEIELAGRLQASLMPPEREWPRLCPTVPRSIPMRTVGGDLYDFLPVGCRRFGALVADVTGHGIPAALLASAVKMAVAAESAAAADPGAFVAGLNRRLFAPLDSNLVTAVYACVDVDARIVSLVRAGHPAPVLYRAADGTAAPVGEPGVALGLIPEAEYEVAVAPFAPGDRMLLYSDGVSETAAPGGELFAVPRIAEFLAAGAVLPLERCLEALLDALDAHRASEAPRTYDDDVTLVVVECPPAARAAA